MAGPSPSDSKTPVPREGGAGDEFVEGQAIGRYVVLGQLGEGGMGVVLSAYDPKLDRRVAIKLLHQGPSGSARKRLQREARALARLAHPHVIRVHDVGEHEGRIFVAMELVEGGTLAEWVRDERPHWREVLRVFMQAGEGLAAAHAAGLVHRDFKPSNVLMGDDGRVKVTDFGLAEIQTDLSTDSGMRRNTGSHEAALTHPGALVGTPAYMALEQLDGSPVDARTDQFSFCVALYEALAGRRPFMGKNLWQIAEAIDTQRFSAPLPHGVPRAIRRAVVRGLRKDPDQRHPDMATVLRLLRQGRWARQRAATVAGALALVGVGVWWVSRRPEPVDTGYCAEAVDRLAGVWDDERRAAAADAFEDSDLPYAEQTWARVEERMDRQARAWVQARRSACEARAGDGAHNPALTRRMVCLHRRYSELERLGALWVEADADLVERAPSALDALGSIDACLQQGGGEAVVDDEATRAHTEALAELSVLHLAGRYDDTVAAADRLVAQADARSRAMQADALLARARALEDAGRFVEAERDYHEAFSRAVAGANHEVTLNASLGLALLIGGAEEPRFEEAERWTEHAAAALEREGREDDLAVAHIEHVRSQLDLQGGSYEAALEHGERALELEMRGGGQDHPRLPALHENLGRILARLRHYDDAIEHHRHALELMRNRYGDRHPRVAVVLSLLGATYSDAGQIAESIEIGTEAVALLRHSVGDEHPRLATALINLGTAYSQAGRAEEAERSFLEALKVVEATYGAGHRRAALALTNLGVHFERIGRIDEAERYHRSAVETFRAALGPSHPRTAIAIANLSSVLIKADQLDDAEALLQQTVATLEEGLGEDHPEVAVPLALWGQVLVLQGRVGEAAAIFERVLALRQPGQARPVEIADACMALGDVLWMAGKERPRAIELVTRAHELYVEIGQARAGRRDRARAWLEERGARP